MHEIIVASIHGGRADDVEKVQIAQMVRISIVHKASPTPRPTPRPTPKPLPLVTPHPVVAVVSTPAPAAPKAKAGLAKSIAKTRYHSKRIVQHVNVSPKHLQGPGLGAAGSGRGKLGVTGTGTGQGGAGNGTGTGGNGNGNYAGAGEPCGFVEFVNINGAQFDKSTGGFHHDIRMTVHLGGGGLQGIVLDYRWYYPSEAADPWSDQNIKNQDFPTNFQFPPADKRGAEPPVVQYVISHSTPEGLTTLKDCRGT
ncbi:MAG: hypothetical protein GIW97_05570 [Candidatus Eremiobacteraeota bacterium]|nr:hypothetical protein [Candidatus Eremiobacteraeota bacterium]